MYMYIHRSFTVISLFLFSLFSNHPTVRKEKQRRKRDKATATGANKHQTSPSSSSSSGGRDGSEAVGDAQPRPLPARVELLSVEMAKTAVVALQGCQAVHRLHVRPHAERHARDRLLTPGYPRPGALAARAVADWRVRLRAARGPPIGWG